MSDKVQFLETVFSRGLSDWMWKHVENNVPIPNMEYTTPSYSFRPSVAPGQQLKKKA